MKGSDMPSALRHPRVLAALALVGLVAGCSSINVRQPIASVFGSAEKPKTPARVVAIWTDATAQRPDGPSTRGFGGRLMFYGPDGDTPLLVDGSLVVYAFDEHNRGAVPDRKYVFTPEQFARHHSKSKLGHSYSVWIPAALERADARRPAGQDTAQGDWQGAAVELRGTGGHAQRSRSTRCALRHVPRPAGGGLTGGRAEQDANRHHPHPAPLWAPQTGRAGPQSPSPGKRVATRCASGERCAGEERGGPNTPAAYWTAGAADGDGEATGWTTN
jgi:hypothetical protein